MQIEKDNKSQKSLLRRLAGNWGIRFGIIVVLGLLAYEAYQNHWIPGINQTEGAFIPNATSYNKTDEQSFRADANITLITEEELPGILKNAVKPLEKNSFPDVAILFPIKLAGDQKDQTIKMSTVYTSNGLFNPVTGEREYTPMVFRKEFTIPKAKTEIIMFAEGAEVFQVLTQGDNGKPYFRNMGVQFFGPDGTRFCMIISLADTRGQLIPTEIVKDAPFVEYGDLLKNNPNVQKGKGLSVPVGTAILTTGVKNTVMGIGLNFATDGKRTCSDFILAKQDGKTFVLTDAK